MMSGAWATNDSSAISCRCGALESEAATQEERDAWYADIEGQIGEWVCPVCRKKQLEEQIAKATRELESRSKPKEPPDVNT